MLRKKPDCTRLVMLLTGMLLALGAGADVVRLSEPVESTDAYETFGAPLPDLSPTLALNELLENGAAYLEQEVLIETRVAQVCQAKGCFFIAQEGAHAVRVSFRDYSFFVPSDISGKTVTLAGLLVQRELSDAQAAHLNEDAGGEPVVQAGAQFEIVASAVRIPR